MSGAGSPERPIEPPSPPGGDRGSPPPCQRVCEVLFRASGSLIHSRNSTWIQLSILLVGLYTIVDCEWFVSLLVCFLVSLFLGCWVSWYIAYSICRYTACYIEIY